MRGLAAKRRVDNNENVVFLSTQSHILTSVSFHSPLCAVSLSACAAGSIFFSLSGPLIRFFIVPEESAPLAIATRSFRCVSRPSAKATKTKRTKV